MNVLRNGLHPEVYLLNTLHFNLIDVLGVAYLTQNKCYKFSRVDKRAEVVPSVSLPLR